MVKLRFVVRGGILNLRIAEGDDRYYKRVGYLLKGDPNLKHFNTVKQKFTAYAVSYMENNRALSEFRQIYWNLIQERPELTAKQVASYYKHKAARQKPSIEMGDWAVSEYSDNIDKYIQVIVLRERAKQGCNYEVYQKLLSCCRKEIRFFDSMKFSSLTYNRMVEIAHAFACGKGYRNKGKVFRAMLGRASKDPNVEFKLSQIGDFVFKDYDPDLNVVVNHRPEVLNSEQLRWFTSMRIEDVTPDYKNRKDVELYYDFCMFMFHSFFSPCDIIKLKYRDITRQNTIVAKRKKTHKKVEVPITPVMSDIIEKYRGVSKDGYVFPIMDDEVEREYSATKDYVFKHFRQRLNIWLKSLGKQLDVDYALHAYVFRHTAITVALDNGLPVSYIANAAGTSIEMIQSHYYNGENERNREMLTRAFMSAGA